MRSVDRLGRVHIPGSVRREHSILPLSDIEIYVIGDAVIIEKYTAKCCFCGSEDSCETYKHKSICKGCIDEINQCHDLEQL